VKIQPQWVVTPGKQTNKQTTKKEEAKARHWAVKIQPQWIVTPGKQTNNKHHMNLNDPDTRDVT
jgi:hypothetical protein